MNDYTNTRGGSVCHSVFDSERLTNLLQADATRATAIVGILTNVIASGCSPVKEARSALQRKQPSQAAHVIHNLKGCIANLGGAKVFTVASALETKLEAGLEKQEAESLLCELQDELSAYLTEAQEWLHTASIPMIGPSGPLNRSHLYQLKHYLLDNNILACDAFDELREPLQNHLSTRDFNGLSKAMESLNFAKAVAHLTTAQLEDPV